MLLYLQDFCQFWGKGILTAELWELISHKPKYNLDTIVPVLLQAKTITRNIVNKYYSYIKNL